MVVLLTPSSGIKRDITKQRDVISYTIILSIQYVYIPHNMIIYFDLFYNLKRMFQIIKKNDPICFISYS